MNFYLSKCVLATDVFQERRNILQCKKHKLPFQKYVMFWFEEIESIYINIRNMGTQMIQPILYFSILEISEFHKNSPLFCFHPRNVPIIYI